MEEHTVSQEKTPEQKQQQQQTLNSTAASSGGSKTRASSKSSRSAIGGSAVPGAKSTQAKQTPASNPREQQAENYNRQMRRRMEHLGTGAYDEGSKMQKAQQQRKKRIERKKQRLEEQRQEIRKTMPKGGIKLGRSTLYFIIGTAILVILVIALFIIIRHPF
jgi:hypothetical protein